MKKSRFTDSQIIGTNCWGQVTRGIAARNFFALVCGRQRVERVNPSKQWIAALKYFV